MIRIGVSGCGLLNGCVCDCVCILPPQIAAVADMPIIILSVLPLSISFQLVV